MAINVFMTDVDDCLFAWNDAFMQWASIHYPEYDAVIDAMAKWNIVDKFSNIQLALSCIVAISGHNISKLDKLISKCLKDKKNFNIIIAKTIKGKGLRAIENNPAWHHKAPSKKELQMFKKELKI